MNAPTTTEFSVSGISFRRAEDTYTARLEVNWGIQALPYVYEEVVVGTESAEYLAAAEELTVDQLLQLYPPSVVVPGYTFSASAVCQTSVTVFAHERIHSGYVSIAVPGGQLFKWEDGEWADSDGRWDLSLVYAVLTDPSASQAGEIRSRSFQLFVGDPADECATDSIGGGGTDEGTGTTTPSSSSSGGGNMGGTISPPPSDPDASMPGCVTLTEWTCPEDTSDTACDRSCRNPFYAMDNPDECDAPTVASVRVEPATIPVTVGRRTIYRVVATFSDGRQGDVTSEATAVVQDSAVASLLAKGILSGDGAGTTSLTVSWKGRSAVGVIAAAASACTDETFDVVFVLDQAVASYWMATRPGAPGCGVYWRRSQGNSDYMAEYGTAALSLMLGLSLKNVWDDEVGNDRVALVVTGDGSPRMVSTWSDTVLPVSSLCAATTNSKLGEALRIAKSLMLSARSGSTKLVVLLTVGSESSCSPSAATVAAELADAGVLLAAVTPLNDSAPWLVYSPCTYPALAEAYLEGLATAGLYFEDPLGLDCTASLAVLRSTICGL